MTDIEAAKAIRWSIQHGDTATAVRLITEGQGRLEMMTPFGTWLHVAAKAGRLNIVRALVETGVDINRRGGTFGGAAINLAASYGHIEVVRYLLDHGAELDVSEPERNPLFSAVYGGHLHIVKLLVERGIDQRIVYTGDSMQNMTARAFALERGQMEIAAYLVEK